VAVIRDSPDFGTATRHAFFAPTAAAHPLLTVCRCGRTVILPMRAPHPYRSAAAPFGHPQGIRAQT